MKVSRILIIFGAVFFFFGMSAFTNYSSNHFTGYLIVIFLFAIAFFLDVFLVVYLWRKGL